MNNPQAAYPEAAKASMPPLAKNPDVIPAIEMVIKALGTMVQTPQYEKDPNQIGKENFLGLIQHPILQGAPREKALQKLSDLIESL